MRLPELQSKIQNAPNLDFGTIFNQSIELFKKVWLQGLLTLIISSALMVPFYILMYLPLIALGLMEQMSVGQSGDPSFFIVLPMVLIVLVFVFFAMCISFSLLAAFYRICRNKDLGIEASDNYFYFLKKQYLGKVMKLALISVGIVMLAMLLCGLPIIYAMVPLSFFSIIFAFNPELSSTEIAKASFSLGNKKWFLTFGLIVVASFLAQIVGLLMCFIGVFVTAFFAYIPVYFVYKGSVGFENGDELEQIGNRYYDGDVR
ncbi:MAG TPA: hypothetical protein PKL92_01835 [Aquaticitalea sp.]|nr:hypothetical protein [Aquaticitalea sp.]HNU59981.1 hypothetical protein [Aquaticitalea sp.]